MKFLKSVLIGTYVLLIILLLLNNCHGCQPKAHEDELVHKKEIVDTISNVIQHDDTTSTARAEIIGHDGKLKITLLWDFPGDIDLHVVQPNGFEIYYKDNHKKDSSTGGYLDVDNQAGGNGSAENIYWENPPVGTYTVSLVYYNEKDGGEGGGPCTVVVKREINGRPKVESFKVNVNTPNKDFKVFITEFKTL